MFLETALFIEAVTLAAGSVSALKVAEPACPKQRGGGWNPSPRSQVQLPLFAPNGCLRKVPRPARLLAESVRTDRCPLRDI